MVIQLPNGELATGYPSLSLDTLKVKYETLRKANGEKTFWDHLEPGTYKIVSYFPHEEEHIKRLGLLPC